MKLAGPIVVILVLVAALSFLSKGMQRNAVADHDEDAPQQTSDTKKDTPKTPAPAPLAQAAPPGTDPIPAEEQIGDPKTAKHKVVVGWTYTPDNQAKTEALQQTLTAVRQMAQQSHGAVSVQIVNLDVPAADRSPAAKSVSEQGIIVDGKSVGMDDNPGSGSTIPPRVFPALSALAH
ncbi:hypothetical protein CCAX7_002300 [Capsulimonas corticalis]|uniref:Uncharacterized protein n=1 Tax=Capsulimonas corticalis TaxID=2219043 RepID=A0A402CRQ2_9BACT|nr:hypothetical protein [Capsulimonas corticalis]BDI28179.1 hypothetical protein CCAX7_002300 [Capsulimonas corticalis]